ncbi:MAG: hypothetical protein EXR62_06235 [Chloroflexi bacterium]|nr:hypothetical protein [Chloroflexota bacterium]
MRKKRTNDMDIRIQAALAELQEIIKGKYPEAEFEIGAGEDPPGIYLRATIDAEDMNDVIDVFIDRLLDIQIEEELPVYVIPIRPLWRVAEMMARK